LKRCSIRRFTVNETSVRFTDGTGLTLTDSTVFGTTAPTSNLNFAKLTTAGDLKLVTSKLSTSPSIQNVEVSDTGSTSDILMNTFTMKPTGADMTMTTLPISVTTTGTGTATQIAQNLVLKADGVQVAEIDTVVGDANAKTANTFTLDNDLNMPAGTPVTFAIYAKVNKIGTNTFAQGDSMTVTVDSGVSLETTLTGATKTSTGSSAGSAQKFFSQGALVTYASESYTAEITGTSNPANGTIAITMNVTAFGDNDVTIDQTEATSQAKAVTKIGHTLTGATETAATVTCSGLTASNGLYTISAGSTNTCTLTSKFNTTTGFVKLSVGSVDNSDVSNVETAAH